MTDDGFRRARAAAGVVIVAACVSVAQVLWGVLDGRASVPVVPTARKVLTGALWVVAAVRFRSALASFSDPEADPDPGASGATPRPADRPEAGSRGLGDVFRNDTRLISKAAAQREPRDPRDVLEVRPCRT